MSGKNPSEDLIPDQVVERHQVQRWGRQGLLPQEGGEQGATSY
jgi:hypothetical protein